jgi:hypothetical protein
MQNASDLFRRASLEVALLGVAGVLCIAFVASLLLIPDNSFVHPDFYRYILPETLRDGLPFQWRDLVNSMQLRSPGEFRPRFLAYLIQAFDQKVRLSLYDGVLVLPSLSPLSWVLELVVGPYYLFRAVQNLTQDRRAAFAAVLVYASTTGFLSGLTMILLQGKNLSNVAVILCVYFASQIVRTTAERPSLLVESPGPHKYLLLLFLFLGLFLDEMPVFTLPLIPTLFPRLFVHWPFGRPPWRKLLLNALFYGIPVFAFLLVVLVAVPPITEAFFGFRFDYLGNTLLIGANTRGAHSLLEGPYARFSWHLVYDNAMTLFGFAAVPSELSAFVKSSHGDYAGTQLNNPFKWAVVLCTIGVGAALGWRGKAPARCTLRLMPAAFFGFFLFLTLLLVRHIPVATGFYYGAIFAALFALFIGLCYGAIAEHHARPRIVAAATVLALVVIGARNFSQVNRGWITTHNDGLTRASFGSVVSLAEPRELRSRELKAIWRSWKDGRLTQYLDTTAISTGAVYLVAELQALDRVRLGTVPQRHVLVTNQAYWAPVLPDPPRGQ